MTILGRVEAHAKRSPEAPALSFLGDGENVSDTLSYSQLVQRARALATRINKDVRAGDRALLVYPPGLDFLVAFFACLYARVIAVPVYPPDPRRLERSLKRLEHIVRDAQPECVLTVSSLAAAAKALPLHGLQKLPWIASDSSPELSLDTGIHTLELPRPGDTAFLQYTSGSTAAPKGVVVRHDHIVANSAYIAEVEGNDETSIALTWLPSFHDMGLIEGLLQPLYSGFPGYLMPTSAFLERPLRWLELITRLGITNSGGPNFAFELCARRAKPSDIAHLKLGSWRVAYDGAEPVHAETYERFVEVFGPCGFRRTTFYPVYGMAEATLMISSKHRSDLPLVIDVDRDALELGHIQPPARVESGRQLVGCGRVGGGFSAVIVNPADRTPASGQQVGEIWLRGSSVAEGYFENTDATRETFGAHLADGSGPFLRTGDLGFFHGDQIFVTGRIKELIIVRGRNVYPQDIERAAESAHPAVKQGGSAAFAISVNGNEEAGIVCEIDEAKVDDPQAVAAALGREVAHLLELSLARIVLVKKGELPKTSSGKVQRGAARELSNDPAAPVLARFERTEELAAPRAAEPRSVQGEKRVRPVDHPAAVLEAHARAQPDKNALRFMRWRMSYGSLDAQANRLAHMLASLGVGANDVVAAFCEPGLEYVAALFAIWKLGAVCLPLDPEWPAPATRALLQNEKPRLIVRLTDMTMSFPIEIPAHELRELIVRAEAMPQTPPTRPASLAVAAKLPDFAVGGALCDVPTAALLNRCQFMAERFALQDGDVCISRANISRIDSLAEILTPLVSGGELYVGTPQDMKCPAYLAQHMVEEGVTRFQATPTDYRLLFSAVISVANRLASVREWFACGEPTQTRFAAAAKTRLPGVHIRTIFGPLALAGAALIEEGDRYQPLPNIAVSVDPDGRLIFSAPWMSEPLTSAFAGAIDARGVRVFGLRDGSEIVFGSQIRLEPIRAALLADPRLADADVAVSEDLAGERRCAAYAVAKPGVTVAGSDLRKSLSALLPPALAPSSYTVVDSLPRLVSGEVDTARLPPPPWVAKGTPIFDPPVGPIEIVLAQLWSDALLGARISRTSDFFDLGGDSLTAMHVAFHAQERGLPLTAKDMHEQRVLRVIASLLAERGRA